MSIKVLITGSNGFIARNLIVTLQLNKDIDILIFDRNDSDKKLDLFTKECDFVFHLAGVNRPKDDKEFIEGNCTFTNKLLKSLRENKNTCPILFASSTQALLDNPYGRSKKAAEELILDHKNRMGSKVLIYRFPNVFGKWCKPNYNSVIATFCYNISRNLQININDPSTKMKLVYIDDVVNEMINSLFNIEHSNRDFYEVPTVYEENLGEIAKLIYLFKSSRQDNSIPDMSNLFIKKLYSTYLSYLPENEFNYELKMNMDERGSFTEFIKTKDRGQISVNISKPGIIKGNHWHHTKNEKFLVVSGKGVIRLRKIDTNNVIEYFVSGEKLEVIDIPVGYTHNIENLSKDDMVTIMWANEPFDKNNPDTFFINV